MGKVIHPSHSIRTDDGELLRHGDEDRLSEVEVDEEYLEQQGVLVDEEDPAILKAQKQPVRRTTLQRESKPKKGAAKKGAAKKGKKGKKAAADEGGKKAADEGGKKAGADEGDGEQTPEYAGPFSARELGGGWYEVRDANDEVFVEDGEAVKIQGEEAAQQKADALSEEYAS